MSIPDLLSPTALPKFVGMMTFIHGLHNILMMPGLGGLHKILSYLEPAGIQLKHLYRVPGAAHFLVDLHRSRPTEAEARACILMSSFFLRGRHHHHIS
jgi:hypothetical protein